MNRGMWIIVGAFVFALLLWTGRVWIGEKVEVEPESDTQLDMVYPELSREIQISRDKVNETLDKKVQIIKDEANETFAPTIVKKRRDISLSVSPERERATSKEEFMERLDEHRENVARERGDEALERYYKQKERREEKILKREARREASKAYHEAYRAWRVDLKKAIESGDESQIRALELSRPKRSLYKRFVDQ